VVSPSPSYCSLSQVYAINALVAFYDIHGGKREVLFFYFVPDTTRDEKYKIFNILIFTISLVLWPRGGRRERFDFNYCLLKLRLFFEFIHFLCFEHYEEIKPEYTPIHGKFIFSLNNFVTQFVNRCAYNSRIGSGIGLYLDLQPVSNRNFALNRTIKTSLQ
jgi:hypothetical protein